jgi:quinol monooxygenase YgiN
MIIVCFKVRCRPDNVDDVTAAMAKVVTASRDMDGVMTFDVGRDVTDPDTLIATEVFADTDARSRQEALPEVAAVMALMPDAAAGPPQVQIFDSTPVTVS